ncbi:hypothetical protein SOVF_101600 [Spinacia oleracea]|uniref:Uncharacterized protein isoform X3 n=1 Tax=Spinacia oleracea TaxID=3562 RepID=A0ABM3R0E0_SPIOL|nr:uncharacterized protein LOC110805074 isoform X3 [Spinacia oleracea]XP_056689101.1 uncharacterized protein LOC110805074 isoform X3 [Spinacia oleracea]KNA15070.1 hypothetical protein SOVF_101600 [Spinacia oleracea]
MDPPQIPSSSRGRSSKINSILPPSPAPRYASTWDSFPGPSHYPMAYDISGRRPSEYTSYSTLQSLVYSNADNIAIRNASVWDSTSTTAAMINSLVPMASDISGRRPSEYTTYSTSQSLEYSNSDNIAIRNASVWDSSTSTTTAMINSLVPPTFNASASPAPRNASTWDSFGGPSLYPLASDISGRRPSEYMGYSTSQPLKNSNKASNISARKVAAWNASTTAAIHLPRWDAFGDALPVYRGASYWSWLAKTFAMDFATGDNTTPVGINRAFYTGNINYIYEFRKGKRLAMADIEAIMYIYGVENTSAQDIVKNIDPKKRGIFDLNSHNKQIVLASTINFSLAKEPDLCQLRHASKCYQDELLSPLHYACYIQEVLKGKYLGSEPRFMMLGMYSVLGVLEGSTDRELTTKDVEKFVRLWKVRDSCETQGLINTVKDDYNGTISCSSFYYLLYHKILYGKQCIHMFDTLGEQKPSMFFLLMDKDEDGFLSLTDLRSFAAIFGRYPSDEAIDRVTRKLDIDGDGKVISLEDFHEAMEPILDGLTWEFWLVAILITLEL